MRGSACAKGSWLGLRGEQWNGRALRLGLSVRPRVLLL